MHFTHTIISAYGFWLPNDPRGSGSNEVRAQHLYEAGGEATMLRDLSRSVAHRTHDQNRRLATKQALKWPPVKFTGKQALAVVQGIAMQLPKTDLVLHALSIMPDHLHVVARTSTYDKKKLWSFLKASGTRGLNAASIHPLANQPRSNGTLRSPWAEKGWSVWLNSREDVLRAIRYVDENPVKAGLRRQVWSCVTPYE